MIAILAVVAGSMDSDQKRARSSEQLLQPISVGTLARLLDESDQTYLQEVLSRQDFLLARRKRIAAAIEYTQRIRANAAVLLRAGEFACKSEDPAVARNGETVVDVAMKLRVQTFLALCRFRLALIVPSMSIQDSRLIPAYSRLQILAGELHPVAG